MLNFYRWYPTSKVVFLASTKPLVTQQASAFCEMTGVPHSQLVELLASDVPKRRKQWQDPNLRVYFCTPQILEHDLDSKACSTSSVSCLVVDECHRAVGQSSVVKALATLHSARARFRLLGLSATPATTFESIQKLITTLRISNVEFRSEIDPDVSPYTFVREVEVEEVEVEDGTSRLQGQIENVMRPILHQVRLSLSHWAV